MLSRGAMYGTSGGPLVDLNGELVGMFKSANIHNFAMATSVICKISTNYLINQCILVPYLHTVMQYICKISTNYLDYSLLTNENT